MTMGNKDDLRHALSLMETALEVLDKADEGLEVSAHLDLAIHRLKVLLGEDPSEP
jgi:hypothetical protein